MTTRPNYRHSGARCCATCEKRRTDWTGNYLYCTNGIEIKDRDDVPEQEIEPDYICDDYESEVRE